MYRTAIAALLICLIPAMGVWAQTPGSAAKKKSIKNQKVTQSAKKDDVATSKVDEIQEHYLKMQHSLNSDIEQEHKNLNYQKATARAAYSGIMGSYDLARKYGTSVNHSRIKEYEEQRKTAYQKWEACELRIATLDKEKEKLKMDALKYYKGRLPDSFSKAWEGEEEQHLHRLPEKEAIGNAAAGY